MFLNTLAFVILQDDDAKS
jgi:hypothetical protein